MLPVDQAGAPTTRMVTVKVMKGTEATSVKVDPSKYGFLSIQLQDEGFAQQFVNTDEVIADLSDATLGSESAADIATTLDVADGRVTVTDVRLAAQTLRGADYLQLRQELYLEQVVTVLQQAAAEDSDVPPTSAKEVVPCVHTGQLMWDCLGAYTVLRLEQKGIISLGHKGIIDVRDKRIDDELLVLANVLNDVTSLDIASNRSITTCEPFAETLVELKAAQSVITDEGLKHCTKLRKLDVSSAHGVTTCAPFADTLEELVACAVCELTSDAIQGCTKLRKLDVRHNPNVTTCDSCKQLEELTASHGFTEQSLQQVAEHCHHLKHLDLSWCDRGVVTDDLITTFAEHCRDLQYLDVSYARGVTDAPIIALGENCRQLRNLVVSGCAAITDAAITKVAENCPELDTLNVARTYNITDASIKKVAEHCPRLQRLNVGDTIGHITDASIVEIAKNCPSFTFLNATATGRMIGGDELKLLLPSTRGNFLTDKW